MGQPMSFASFICPFIPLGRIASQTWGGSQILYCVAFGMEWAVFIVMLCLGAADKAFFAMAIAAYFCFALTVAGARSSVRQKLGITGDLLSDACASCFYLPFAVGQMAGEDFTETPLVKADDSKILLQKPGQQKVEKLEDKPEATQAEQQSEAPLVQV